ncbi:unnamed protein product [Bursaphelenchus okinawaensis]|uniref:Uncharacterized protein n=1 Tax=Bursaphelenchus okinawaensis TaxID=465554 RepID=A0A811JVC6_9BILA|nr:unnamed protein product [Bursaphelenchus okinawaensis]CAG9084803.1 unnamed protein product [Bursaphelenchus okinawaensis]
MRDSMRLCSPLLLNAFLLFLATSVNGEKPQKQIGAEEVKNALCPQCHKMEDGMIQEFHVVRQVGGSDIFTFTSINGTHTSDVSLYNGYQYYELRYVPVFTNGTFQPYMVEITPDGQFKRIQRLMDDGMSYQYNDLSKKLSSNKVEYCYFEKKYEMDHNVSFPYFNLYIPSKTQAYELDKVCADGFGPKDAKKLLSSLPAEVSRAHNKSFIDKCFDVKDKTCVYDIDNPAHLNYFEGKKDRIAYMRNGLIVYLRCVEFRCTYFIHDSKTGLDWWIPDDIKVYTETLKGDKRLIVPLLRLDDKFYTSELRYKYAPSTTTTSTTTPNDATRPTDEPGGESDATTEHHEDDYLKDDDDDDSDDDDRSEAEGADWEESGSAQNVVLMWIVVLMLFMY